MSTLHRFILMAGAAFCLSAAALPASALQITLPPDTATLEPSTLPGYQKALQNCTACHTAAYMQTQPASSQAWWTAEVHKMKKAYGAPIPEADMDAIAEYMYKIYGSGDGASRAYGAAHPAAKK
ncbi:MAG TPA: cytochrome c [Castellaniella sp.]|uniref:SorB family sulfite dehydrogenase c-type cytochrome subunit n=1 Tax=Castellaniella sp. TaxID=1955812 RepID=UPI002EF55FA6